MSEGDVIEAVPVGNPASGLFDDPWAAGHPAEGERVAIFAYEVLTVDGEPEGIRTFHLAPPDSAQVGQVGEVRRDPQGVSTRWRGCGTGTVTEAADPDDLKPRCQVTPDEPDLA